MNQNPAVEAWLAKSRSPQKSLMAAVRQVMLSSDPRVVERLSWRVPSFAYKGDMATFFTHAQAFVCLLFHDTEGLEGDFPSLRPDAVRGMQLRIKDETDLAAKRGELTALVRAFCDLKDRRAT